MEMHEGLVRTLSREVSQRLNIPREDVAQELRLALLNCIEKIKRAKNPNTYAKQVLRNRKVDFYRAAKRVKQHKFVSLEALEETKEKIFSAEYDIDTQMLANEVLNDALLLGEDFRDVLQLVKHNTKVKTACKEVGMQVQKFYKAKKKLCYTFRSFSV